MTHAPSDEDLYSELASLSDKVFGPVGLDGDVGPTRNDWDALSNRQWCRSEALLRLFGLPTTSDGWRVLLNAYSYEAPTRGQAKLAYYARPKPSLPRVEEVDYNDEYDTLHGTAREEVAYMDLGYGWCLKRTRTFVSLR